MVNFPYISRNFFILPEYCCDPFILPTIFCKDDEEVVCQYVKNLKTSVLPNINVSSITSNSCQFGKLTLFLCYKVNNSVCNIYTGAKIRSYMSCINRTKFWHENNVQFHRWSLVGKISLSLVNHRIIRPPIKINACQRLYYLCGSRIK